MKVIAINNKIINYKIVNPGGNKTALVLSNKYNINEKKVINDKILKENQDVEQVGFLECNKFKLEMAGGEFCVNATRCAIWEYLNGEEGEIELSVSGFNGNIKGGITKEKNVYVNLPINKRKDEIIKINKKLNIIKLDGIVFGIIDEISSKKYIEKIKKDEEKTKIELKEIMKKIKTKENAIGIILLEKLNYKIKINPIVWVKTVDTLYYETACGSGSLATAIYTSYIEKENTFEIIQPSNYSIFVELNIEKEIIKNAKLLGKIVESR